MEKMNRKAVCGIMLSVVIIGIFGTVFNSKQALSTEVCSQDKAPDFTLTDMNGIEFSLSDYLGKVVLIDFCRVTPSCPPCISEIPHLKGVYNQYPRSEVIIMFISVSSLDTDDALRDFVEQYDIPWIVACGKSQVVSDYDIEYVPTLVIVDQEGYIRYEHVGLTEESVLIPEIETLLSTPPVITATVDIHPRTLNSRSRGKWIVAYIELPEDYDVNYISVFTIMLNDTVPAEMHPVGIGDEDGDCILDLMVKFNRTELVSWIYNELGILYGKITLTITGKLYDGTPFEGTDTIRLLLGGGSGKRK